MAAKPTWVPVLVRLADVEAESVTWFWKPYIASGKLTLLEGDPGLGKTWLSLVLAAASTKGHPLPGEDGTPGAAREPRNVIYMSAEDGLGDTLRPRLDAAGADVSRVFAITGKRTTDEEGEPVDAAISLADIPVLRSAIETVQPALVIIDPLQAYLGAAVDMHRANEVRPLLTALSELAQSYNFAVVVIRHLRKSSSDRAIHRGAGSIDFAAAARSILLVGEDPENDTRRVIAHVKSSLAPAGHSLGFELRDGAFTWLGHSNVTADQLLAPRPVGEERSAQDEATEWLADTLANGPVAARDLKRYASDAGLAWRTVERAKQSLGVTAKRASTGNSGAGVWLWTLPNPSSENAGGLALLAENTGGNSTPARPPASEVAALPETRPQRQEPQDRKAANASPLGLIERAQAVVARLATLEAVELENRLGALLQSGSAPEWFRTAAITEPVAVTATLELIAEDTRNGTLAGKAPAYLAAARAAATAREEAPA